MRRPIEYCDALYSTAFTARLCPDVLLRAFGKAYPAHRVILASQSAYFETLLRWGLGGQPAAAPGPPGAEAEEWIGLRVHHLVLGEDVTQRGFEWILEYFYASPHVAITRDNAFEVLAAAHYLGVTAVQTACVEFLAQHLDPQNFAACLMWATRADHGEASDMLAASCRRLLALRLPTHLAAWAPALAHIEPHTLLEIMSSDHLAVPTEYVRYGLVKEVAKICAAAAAAVATETPAAAEDVHGAVEAAMDEGGNDGGAGAIATATAAATSGKREVQRMLSSALRLSDEGLAGHLELTRSYSAAAGLRCPGYPPSVAAAAAGAEALPRGMRASSSSCEVGPGCVTDADSDAGVADVVGGASPRASAMGTSPSESSACVEAVSSSVLTSSQASSRSTVRLCELGGGGDGGGAMEDGGAGEPCGATAPLAPSPPKRPPPALERPANGDEGDHGAAAAAGQAAAAPAAAPTMAACAQLLLHEAVRYEHLTVPQLMAVEREGLVASEVLHAALWERTRLDCRVHAWSRFSQQVRSGPEPLAAHGADAAGGGGGGGLHAQGAADAAEAAVRARVRVSPLQPTAMRFRAFRVCWHLACGSLKKLQPRGMLQSELHQHAGALWQLRLCGSDRSRDHLGLFVGRHLASSAAAATAALAGCIGAEGAGQQQPEPGREAAAAAAAAAGREPQRRQPGGRHHPRRQPLQEQQQAPASAPPPGPFFAYMDQGSLLRGRCRLSVLQSDNTALQGRLCLGDTGDFTADFAAGGYFGQGQLVSRADLAALPDEQEVLVFMSLTVLVDD